MDRQSGRRTRETARCVTCAVTETIVEGTRPRDDAALGISDSALTEVEIAVGEYLGRDGGNGERRNAETDSGAAPKQCFSIPMRPAWRHGGTDGRP
jgi:hypothetical protein